MGKLNYKSPQMNLPFSIMILECHDVKGENDICLLKLSIVLDLTCVLCHNMNKLSPEECGHGSKSFENFPPVVVCPVALLCHQS